MPAFTMMLLDSLLHMAGESVVASGEVGADRKFERIVKAFEFAMEIQKQKREDLRDLIALRVDRMDMYQLVCALLMGFCMMMFCENPLIDKLAQDRTYQWLLIPFLVSNISAFGFLVLSLWLSLQCSVDSQTSGVQHLLQYMRVTIPTVEDLRALGVNPAENPPKYQQEEQQFVIAGQVQQVDDFNPKEHVRKFLQNQRKDIIWDAYARLALIIGVNQLMQALSYYLIADLFKSTKVGAVLSVVGIQFIACALLRLDVVQISYFDIFKTVSCQVLPPFLTCIVAIYQTPKSRILNLVPSVSFLLHVLWMAIFCRSAKPKESEARAATATEPQESEAREATASEPQERESQQATAIELQEHEAREATATGQRTEIRPPIRFQNICVILEADSTGRLDDSPSSRKQILRPWEVTRTFLCTVGALWMCTIVWLCLWTLTNFDHDFDHGFAQHLGTKNLQVSWPKVVGFFELSSMQCTGSAIIASSRFSSYVADHAVQGTTAFYDSGRSKIETMPCSIDGCHTLIRADDGMWRLANLSFDANGQGEDVPIPFHWRAVSAVSAPCPHECHAFWVAGWDTKTEVLLGRLERTTLSMNWDFRILSAVHPALGKSGKSQFELSGPGSYTEVSALQLGVDDKRLTLAVLHHDGQPQGAHALLDAWDLSDAKMLGRWSFNDKYTSMCIAGKQLLVGRTSQDGPSIEVAHLPFELRDDAEEGRNETNAD